MELKRLTQDEYRALPGAEPLERLPVDSVVVAALSDGQVIGRTVLLNMLHLEGTWVTSSRRNGLVGARLIREAQEQAKEVGASMLLAYTADLKHGEYMQRLGYKRVPVEVWAKEI